MRLLEHLPTRSVVCTHGDMLHALADRIVDAGHHDSGSFDKGVIWVLTRAHDGLSVVDVIPPSTIEHHPGTSLGELQRPAVMSSTTTMR